MGYEGKRIKPGQGPETWEFSRGRKVEKFWEEWLVIAIIVITAVPLVLGVVIYFTRFIFPPEAPPQQDQKQEQEKGFEQFIPPMIPPLLFGKPLSPPLPSRQQKRESAIPIYWSYGGHHGHHGDGHHGHYGYHHRYYYPAPYSYPYLVRPWGGYYSYPHETPYGGWGGWEPLERPRCFELRQPDGAYLKWCL